MIIMIHLPSCSIAFLTCSLHCTAAAVTRSQHIGILQYLGRRKPSHRLAGKHSRIPCICVWCDSWSCLRPAPAAPHHLMIGVSSLARCCVLTPHCINIRHAGLQYQHSAGAHSHRRLESTAQCSTEPLSPGHHMQLQTETPWY